MTQSLAERFAELDRLDRARTPGEWSTYEDQPDQVAAHGAKNRTMGLMGPYDTENICQNGSASFYNPGDAAFIAAAPRLMQLARELMAENERLEKLVYVPGVTRCPKCNLRLVSAILNAADGRVAANNEPQQCANGCGPMERVTEREAGNELVDQLDALRDAARSTQQ